MRILLTNDDGIEAPGLLALYPKLQRLGEVFVVAPDGCRSGASHSISLQPIVCRRVQTDLFTGYSITGSPADCVKLAVRQIFDEAFDLVVSGMNCGANVGINVHYSGTVAGAAEAAIQGIPAAAISASCELGGVCEFERASEYGMQVLEKALPLAQGDVININVPKLSAGKPKGVKVSPQSQIPYIETYLVLDQHDGEATYQITGQPNYDGQVPFDTAQLQAGYITVTALHMDMTDQAKNERLEEIEF